MATNAISKAFGDDVTLSRKNIVIKIFIYVADDELIQLDQESEIKKIKCLMQVTKERITGWRQEIGVKIRNENCDPLQFKSTF